MLMSEVLLTVSRAIWYQQQLKGFQLSFPNLVKIIQMNSSDKQKVQLIICRKLFDNSSCTDAKLQISGGFF